MSSAIIGLILFIELSKMTKQFRKYTITYLATKVVLLT